MRLGTRWSIGRTVPVQLPDSMVLAIRTVENELHLMRTDTKDLRWTLTWVEDRPVIDLDDGTQIRHGRGDDSVTIERCYADFS